MELFESGHGRGVPDAIGGSIKTLNNDDGLSSRMNDNGSRQAKKKLKLSNCEQQGEKKRTKQSKKSPEPGPTTPTTHHQLNTLNNDDSVSSRMNDNSNRPKRIQKRRFNLAETVRAIEADSD
jgi:hypothetical protein